MAMSPSKECSFRTCHVLVTVGTTRCPEHTKKSWEGARKNSYGPEWPAQRTRVLREERYCRQCRVRRTVTVDHIKPVSEGGTSVRENLQGLCLRCSSIKTTREAARAAAEKRVKIIRRVESWPSTRPLSAPSDPLSRAGTSAA